MPGPLLCRLLVWVQIGARSGTPGRELVVEHVAECHGLPTRRLLANEAAEVPAKGVLADASKLGCLAHRDAASLFLLGRKRDPH